MESLDIDGAAVIVKACIDHEVDVEDVVRIMQVRLHDMGRELAGDEEKAIQEYYNQGGVS